MCSCFTGPGYYYQDSSFVKPTFNRLAVADKKKVTKPEEESSDPALLRTQGGSVSVHRSTLSERKALSVDLVGLIRDSQCLSQSICEFEKLVEEHKTEQAELAKGVRHHKSQNS
jgi:hypothetical protein